MPDLGFFLAFSVLVEGIVALATRVYEPEEGKLWWQCIKWKMILAIIIGVAIGFSAQVRLFATVGVPLTPVWVDYALSGFLASRGSGYVYELVQLIRESRLKVESEDQPRNYGP